MTEIPTTTPPAEDRQPDESTWAQDARNLLAYAGSDWAIVRAHDDPYTLICERTRGTETHVIAGTPRVCLDRIRALPSAPDPCGPAIVRADSGAWISGPGA